MLNLKNKNPFNSAELKKTLNIKEPRALATIAINGRCYLVISNKSGTIRLFDLKKWQWFESGGKVSKLNRQGHIVHSLTTVSSTAGEILISGGWGKHDEQIKIWNPSKHWKSFYTLYGCKNRLMHFWVSCMTPLAIQNKNHLIAGGLTGTIKALELNTWKQVKILKVDQNPLQSLATVTTTDKSYLLSLHKNKVMRVWDPQENWRCIEKIDFDDSVNCFITVDIADSCHLITGGDNSIKIWGFKIVRKSTLISTGFGNNRYLSSVSVDLHLIHELSGHSAPVTCLATMVIKDSLYLFSGSDDNTIKRWYLTDTKKLEH